MDILYLTGFGLITLYMIVTILRENNQAAWILQLEVRLVALEAKVDEIRNVYNIG